MKIHLIAGGLLILAGATACGNKDRDSSSRNLLEKSSQGASTQGALDSLSWGVVHDRIMCKADSSQSYALYIPKSGNEKSLAVIYFFDPHGDGDLPVMKYQKLAEQFHFIFVGSNNSRNGLELQEDDQIWQKLWNDTRTRLPLDLRRIYVCGFSGGGKVASYLGLAHPEISGVIASGAGLTQMESGGDFGFSFTAIAGLGDMNMTDLISISQGLDKSTTRHRLILFDGPHEWPPLPTMEIALDGLQFDATVRKLIPLDSALVNQYVQSSNQRVKAFMAQGNLVRAQEECQLSIHMLQDMGSRAAHFQTLDHQIEGNPQYQKQIQKQQQLFTTEEKIKGIFNQQFQAGDEAYWDKTITLVQQRAREKNSEGEMYQRLQAYLSLAFYTISNQMIEGQRNLDARYFVDLYKKDDPSNAEAWYFSAILHARNHKVDETRMDLLTAVKNGFNDKKRLQSQPEFQSLEPQLGISGIESKMGTPGL